MEKQIKFTEWRNAVTDLPKEDGNYIVCRFYKWHDGTISFSHSYGMEYTTQYGWNTSDTNSSHPIDFAEDVERYITLWSVPTLESEV